MREDSLKSKLNKIKDFSEIIPGIIIIRELENFKPIFVSEKGLKLLHTKLEVIQTETDRFQNSFFHNEDIYDYKNNLIALQKQNDSQTQYTFFQQLRLAQEDEWIWHICSSEIFYRDINNLATHIITIANPINHLKYLPNKVNRLVAENIFFKQNYLKYTKLGKREREVLKLVALGKSSGVISDELFISVDTVNTHRKNIKEKLNIDSNYGFSQYAQAFDLI